MIWNPNTMLLYDVYAHYDSLKKAGLSRIGKKPGETIPLLGKGE